MSEVHYCTMQCHKLRHMHYHAMHVWSYTLCWININKRVDVRLRSCFKFSNVMGAVSSCIVERSWLILKMSIQSPWMASTSSRCGNISGMSMLLKTSSFSGPVIILHFSFRDYFQSRRNIQMHYVLHVSLKSSLIKVLYSQAFGDMVKPTKLRYQEVDQYFSDSQEHMKGMTTTREFGMFRNSGMLETLNRHWASLLFSLIVLAPTSDQALTTSVSRCVVHLLDTYTIYAGISG